MKQMSNAVYTIGDQTILGTKTFSSVITGSITGSAGSVPVASLPVASTSASGIVQLSSATNSTSTTLAATASAVKSAMDTAVAAQNAAAAVRAWVNFTVASSVVTIRNSLNVASVTRTPISNYGVYYTITFTTAMPDQYYSVCGMPGVANISNYSAALFMYQNKTASSVQVGSGGIPGVNSIVDFPDVSIAVFR